MSATPLGVNPFANPQPTLCVHAVHSPHRDQLQSYVYSRYAEIYNANIERVEKLMQIQRLASATVLLAGILAAGTMQAAYAGMTPEVEVLQQRWAEVNYMTQGEIQVEAFSTLIEDARRVTEAQQDSAEAWIWSGIIKSSYAGATGGLDALSSAKAAKADLETALELNADALQGSAYTSLGVLYLFKTTEYEDAQRYLMSARNAPSRPGRELADQGRRGEIERMLQQIEDAK